jgi:hypothetical protein
VAIVRGESSSAGSPSSSRCPPPIGAFLVGLALSGPVQTRAGDGDVTTVELGRPWQAALPASVKLFPAWCERWDLNPHPLAGTGT